MTSPSPFAICSSRVITAGGVQDRAVVVRNGTIEAVMHRGDLASGFVIEDVGDLVVMAGLVDTHVHVNEPGRTEWEGFETATKAAAAGGITTLVDMPLNSSPVTTTVDALQKKISAAQGKLWVDCGFHAGLIPGNARQIPPLIEAGVLGVKAFLIHSGIGEFPDATERDLREAMPHIARAGIPLLVHCELQTPNLQPQTSSSPITHDLSPKTSSSPITPNLQPQTSSSPRSYSSYLSSRPRTWEHDAIQLMIGLCMEYNCRTHIVHLSSADAVPMVRDARKNKLPLTVETCPHYLYFCSEDITDGDTSLKCAPPIRERENRERLWDALRSGEIDFIVSDHSPTTPELKLMKEGDFQRAWGGIASLQFGLPIIWTEARKRNFDMTDVARWMSQRPAELVGLNGRKGKIEKGYDADLVVWNPDASFTVEPSMILHRHKMTPYEGKKLFGKVEKTFVRGMNVFDRGSISDRPRGKVLLRTEK